MVNRSTQQSPDYRPPLAAGQSYPPLGYSDTGAPMFTYDDRERALAGPQPVMAAPPESPAPVVAPPPPENRRNLAIGLAAVVVLVLTVALGFVFLGDSDETPVDRANPPASQPTDDPYLQQLPEQPESSVPRDPEAGDPAPGTGPATVVYEVESGPATILFVQGTRVRLEQNSKGTWKRTIRGSQRQLLRVTVILAGDEPASCSITVDGKVVAEESTGPTPTGMLTCQFES